MKNLRKFFENYNKKQILDSGVLYMFDTKLTKQEHEKIKAQFLSMVDVKKEEIIEKQPEKIIDEKCFQDETLLEIINLKLKSN